MVKMVRIPRSLPARPEIRVSNHHLKTQAHLKTHRSLSSNGYYEPPDSAKWAPMARLVPVFFCAAFVRDAVAADAVGLHGAKAMTAGRMAGTACLAETSAQAGGPQGIASARILVSVPPCLLHKAIGAVRDFTSQEAV